MALSDQLSRLSTRTKVLEDRFAASKEEARAQLEQDVKVAREASQANAEALNKSIETTEAEVSAWWDDVANGWNKHLATVRQHIEHKVAAHDLKSAQRDAEEADEYASYLIDYTYAAVVEAEYAVLDATLAHMRADELAAEIGSTDEEVAS
jgi:hypothetical protein